MWGCHHKRIVSKYHVILIYLDVLTIELFATRLMLALPLRMIVRVKILI